MSTSEPRRSRGAPIRVLRYTLRCNNGHEVEYETSEWPGLMPVHCTVVGCGLHVPVFPVGVPIVVARPDVFGRRVCDYCGDLWLADQEAWGFCCGAQEENARREQVGRWAGA